MVKAITVQEVREKYGKTFANTSDELLQSKIDCYYLLANLGLQSYYNNKHQNYNEESNSTNLYTCKQ